MDGRKVLVACDKFKGSLTAAEVADRISAGLGAVVPTAAVVRVPWSPTAATAPSTRRSRRASPGSRSPRAARPVNRSRPRMPSAAISPSSMADACGLLRLPGQVRAPMTASSRGLGEVLAAALDADRRRIVMGIGGSASTDGGAGMLSALGVRLLDAGGAALPDGGGALGRLARIDLGGIHPALAQTEVTLACDVTNPLLGPAALRPSSPRRRRLPSRCSRRRRCLRHFAMVVTAATGRDDSLLPGAGAAGGVGYAALALLGARMRPGIEVVLEMSHFAELVTDAALVITGEGSLDRQTLLGKTPAGVAAAAAAGGPGRCGLRARAAHHGRGRGHRDRAGVRPDRPRARPAVCMRDAGPLLERLSAQVARGLAGRLALRRGRLELRRCVTGVMGASPRRTLRAVRRRELGHRCPGLDRRRPQVREQDDILHRQQPRVHRGLVLEDVEPGTGDLPGLQRGHEGGLVDDRPRAELTTKAVRFISANCSVESRWCVDGRYGQCSDTTSETLSSSSRVTLRASSLQCGGRRVVVVGMHDRHTEGLCPARHGDADLTHPDDADRLTLQAHAEQGRTSPLPGVWERMTRSPSPNRRVTMSMSPKAVSAVVSVSTRGVRRDDAPASHAGTSILL